MQGCGWNEGLAAMAHSSIVCPTSAFECVLPWIDFHLDATMLCGAVGIDATCRFYS